MSKINAKEAKPKQSEWRKNLENIYNKTNSKPVVDPLISFIDVHN